MTEHSHRDVGGERGPRAFCSGVESGVLCTEDWLDVTCPACHQRRHPGAPLSKGELRLNVRATGPGETRPLTREEALEGWKRLP